MESGQSSELRLEMRSNIFVMAALHSDGRQASPVRVRNLSRTGALVESNLLPSAGTQVRLSRASLETLATIMWVDGSKAGLRFRSPIAVADWLPLGKRGTGQHFADELFHQKRLQSSKSPVAGQLVDTLLELKQSLERSGEELAQNADVAASHRSALQTIDAVAQTLASIAESLAGNGEDGFEAA